MQFNEKVQLIGIKLRIVCLVRKQPTKKLVIYLLSFASSVLLKAKSVDDNADIRTGRSFYLEQAKQP